MSLKDLKPLFDDDTLSKIQDDDELIKKCYPYYVEDFVTNPFQLGEKKIKIISKKSTIPGLTEYPETFAHIVTREYKSQKERFFIQDRAIRVHWVKPILLAHPCNEIKYFKWKDEKEVCKEYFWYFAKDYMVILKNVSTDVQIVTAFCVDSDEKTKFHEWYTLYNEGKSECK